MKSNSEKYYAFILFLLSIFYLIATSFDFLIKEIDSSDLIFSWITYYFIFTLVMTVVSITLVKVKKRSRYVYKIDKRLILVSFIFFIFITLYKISYLDYTSLWQDELTDIILSGDKVAYEACLRQNQPPLFCVINSTVQQFYGASSTYLKLSIMIISSLSCFLFVMICFEITQKLSISIIFGLLYLFSNSLIQYGYEVRPYALGVFHSVIFSYYLFRILNNSVKTYSNYLLLTISAFLFLNSIGMQSALIISSIIIALFIIDNKIGEVDYRAIGSLVLSLILFLPMQIIILKHGDNPHYIPDINILNGRTFVSIFNKMFNYFINDMGVFSFLLILLVIFHCSNFFRFKFLKETRIINVLLVSILLFYFKITALFELFIPFVQFKYRYTLTFWPLCFFTLLYLLKQYEEILKFKRDNKKIEIYFSCIFLLLVYIQVNHYNVPLKDRRDYRGIYNQINKNINSKDRLITICLSKDELCYFWNNERISGNVYLNKVGNISYIDTHKTSVRNVFTTFKNYKDIDKLFVMIHGVEASGNKQLSLIKLFNQFGKVIFNEKDEVVLIIDENDISRKFYTLIDKIQKQDPTKKYFMLEELILQRLALRKELEKFQDKRNKLLSKVNLFHPSIKEIIRKNIIYYEEVMGKL